MIEKIIKALDEDIAKIKAETPDEAFIEEILMDGSAVRQTERIKKIIKNISAEYNNGWIPVSERLPEEEETVWTTVKYSTGRTETKTAIYQSGRFCNILSRDYFSNIVIAWRPRIVPEPYIPVESEET